MIYHVDYDTGEIYQTTRGALEDAIYNARPNTYTPAGLEAMKVSELAAEAARIPELDGFCFSKHGALILSQAYKPGEQSPQKGGLRP